MNIKQKEKYKQMFQDRGRKMKQLENRVKSERVKVETLEAKIAESSSDAETVDTLKEELKACTESIHYLQSLLEDTTDVQLYDEVETKYSDEFFQCVMNLTDLKVPSEEVGAVMKEVRKLCGKTPNVPSASTVNRVVDSKLSVTQKQINAVLPNKKKINSLHR